MRGSGWVYLRSAPPEALLGGHLCVFTDEIVHSIFVTLGTWLMCGK